MQHKNIWTSTADNEKFAQTQLKRKLVVKTASMRTSIKIMKWRLKKKVVQGYCKSSILDFSKKRSSVSQSKIYKYYYVYFNISYTYYVGHVLNYDVSYGIY